MATIDIRISIKWALLYKNVFFMLKIIIKFENRFEITL